MRQEPDWELMSELIQTSEFQEAWKEIAVLLQLDLDNALTRLESDLDPVPTAKVRGQIKTLRHVISLPRQIAEQVSKDRLK
jgi:hypothetical protein